MKITSLAFESKQIIPPKYTCDGEDVNPLSRSATSLTKLKV